MLIGYARVSTIDQTPQAQIDALEAAGCERVFQETASGAKKDRPELAAALDYMRGGDTLVVWKLDRLARSLSQLIETAEALKGSGIALRSLTEQIDTSTPGGTLIFHMFGALAEFERGIIRERTNVGLAAARARGRKGGRKPAMKATDVQAMHALLGSGMFVREVAERLGVSQATIYRAKRAAQTGQGDTG
ncbi:MAG: recombinase family protein [Pseudomonadota bacterium]